MRGLRWPQVAKASRQGRGGRSGAPRPLEREVLRDCLAYLNAHPRVAFAFRANTGLVATPDGKRRFKAGFKGCSDILGMLKGGRLLAVECKRAGKLATPEQQSFLDRVNDCGGLAFVATCIRDCELELSRR